MNIVLYKKQVIGIDNIKGFFTWNLAIIIDDKIKFEMYSDYYDGFYYHLQIFKLHFCIYEDIS